MTAPNHAKSDLDLGEFDLEDLEDVWRLERGTFSWTKSGNVAFYFLSALSGDKNKVEQLPDLVTPESRASWGKFRRARMTLARIPDWGLLMTGEAAIDDDSVRYHGILANTVTGKVGPDDRIVVAESILTLVWRPEFGRWMVHHMGERIRPECIERNTI
jgi:hypothetical protein